MITNRREDRGKQYLMNQVNSWNKKSEKKKQIERKYNVSFLLKKKAGKKWEKSQMKAVKQYKAERRLA